MASSVNDDFSDLEALGIDIDAKGDPLTQKFNKAAAHMQKLASHLDDNTLLKMYAYYKQSLEGPCTTPKPNWYDLRGKAKWQSWMALENMSQTVAKQKYIQGVLDIDPEFELLLTGVENPENSDSWVRVSSFLVKKDNCVSKNNGLVDFIQENNVGKVKELLSKLPVSEINALDSNGMAVIHWAADRGSRGVLELIATRGADINLQDSEGQTALHYAASCGYLDCVEFIVNSGGKTDLKDHEGLVALDVAGDDSVRAMLKDR